MSDEHKYATTQYLLGVTTQAEQDDIVRRASDSERLDVIAEILDTNEEWSGDELDAIARLIDVARSEATTTPIRDETNGSVFEPWTNGYAVGFKVTHESGGVEYVYLNPSSGSIEGYEDEAPTVFLYQGTEGDPGQDPAILHVNIDVTFDAERRTK
jgi:hypothetical protein